MVAPPYVSMNASVASERGQPSVSPLRMAGAPPEMFLMSERSDQKPCQVVGFWRLWAVK